jgi:transglutaminase-like putative cysteine protease
MERLASGERGELSVELRLVLEDIIRYVRPRDQLSLLAALYNWFDRHYHFVKDPRQREQVKDPQRLLSEIMEFGRAIGDCDDASTFLTASSRALGNVSRLVRTGFKEPTLEQQLGADKGRFTHVLSVSYDQYGRAIVTDPVAGRRTPRMLTRVRQYAKSPARSGG